MIWEKEGGGGEKIVEEKKIQKHFCYKWEIYTLSMINCVDFK